MAAAADEGRSCGSSGRYVTGKATALLRQTGRPSKAKLPIVNEGSDIEAIIGQG